MQTPQHAQKLLQPATIRQNFLCSSKVKRTSLLAFSSQRTPETPPQEAPLAEASTSQRKIIRLAKEEDKKLISLTTQRQSPETKLLEVKPQSLSVQLKPTISTPEANEIIQMISTLTNQDEVKCNIIRGDNNNSNCWWLRGKKRLDKESAKVQGTESATTVFPHLRCSEIFLTAPHVSHYTILLRRSY